MPKEKKIFVLKRFTPYMGKKKVLLPLSLVLSGISAVLNIKRLMFQMSVFMRGLPL
jgi:ATP-binding cassette subfamily B protein IrtA